MAQISKQYTFSAGEVITANEHNSNFDNIYNEFNGNISNANISNSAAIAGTKINPAFGSQVITGKNLTLTNSAADTHGISISQEGVSEANKYGLYVYSTAAQTTSQLAKIFQNNASSTQNVLELENDGTGKTLYVNVDGVAALTKYPLHVNTSAAQVNAPTCVFESSNNSSTQNLIHVVYGGSGAALYLSSTAAGGGSHIRFDGDTNNPTPLDGDMWFDGTDLNLRVGTTTNKLGAGSSSTIFSWSGTAWDTNAQTYDGDSLVPSAGTTKYHFLVGNGPTQRQVLAFKWKKLSGVSTVTIYCAIWQETATAGHYATCLVDIGGQNSSVNGTSARQTPEWKNFDIDVSSLTNGTAYDVAVSVTSNTTNEKAYLAAVIGIGS